MKKINSQIIKIFTDGASSGNPGPGGYGVILESGDYQKELSDGFQLTTNNRMELLSVIAGLEALRKENCTVHIFSDSRYVVDAVEKGWVFGWEKNHFKKKKNADLWQRFLVAYRKHQVKFFWIKGHNEHPENERCDELAVAASRHKNLKKDSGYLSGSE